MKILKIGRGSDNDIIINDAKVSRWHLQIVQNEDGKCYAIDLDSSNGTFVNEVRINGETCLHANDEIRVGDTMLPWQTYIGLRPISQSSISQDSGTGLSAHGYRNSKQKLWYVVMGGIVFVLLLGGVVWKIYSDRQIAQEKMIQEKRLYEKQVESFAAKKEAKQAMEDKNEAIRRKGIAESRAQSAEEAKNKAVSEKQKAETAKKQAEKVKAEAERAKRDMENKLKESNQAAEQLLNKLFTIYASTLKSKDWAEIAKELKFSDVQTSEAKGKVEQEFNKKDYAGKKRIIEIMEAVKNRAVNENNKHLEQQQADTIATPKKTEK